MEQYLTNGCGGCGGKKKKKGFTLIELLIVITIIGILAVALLPRVMGAPAKARDVDRKADLNLLATALESYAADNGTYPTTAGCVASVLATPLGSYLSGDVATDPVTGNKLDYDGTVNGAGSICTKDYYYKPLSANGVANTAYVLLAQTEADGLTSGYIDITSNDFTSITTLITKSDVQDIPTATSTSLTGLANVYMLVH